MSKKNRCSSMYFLGYPIQIVPIQSVLLLVYGVIIGFLPSYQTIVIANFINTAIAIFNNQLEYSAIYLSLIMIFIYVVIKEVIPSIMELVEASLKLKMSETLKMKLIHKQASLDYWILENEKKLELVNRVCENPVERFYGGFKTIIEALQLLITISSLLLIVFSSSLIGGSTLLLVSIPLLFLAKKTGEKSYEIQKESKKIERKYNYLFSVLINKEYSEERKLFDYADQLKQKYNELYEKSYDIERKLEIKSFVNAKSGSMVTLLLATIIMGSMLFDLPTGKISIGLYVGLVNTVYDLVQAMSWRLSNTMINYSKLKEYAKDFEQFMGLPEKTDSCVERESGTKIEVNKIEFRNVSFKYTDTENDILRNCSFILEKGKNYAFVGVNGAGKTTIVKLLSGLYDNYTGEILINDINVKEYPYGKIKSMFAIVFQDFARYGISIEENIKCDVRSEDDDARIDKIIAQLELEKTIDSMPQGIRTNLSRIKDDSVDLSGGQWQKIAIARLLYADAAVNILDEPTASLDPVAESRLYELFNEVKNNKFTIYITHRLGAARIADEILVLDNGRIIQRGSHEQLVKDKEGKYFDMYESQSSWYSKE